MGPGGLVASHSGQGAIQYRLFLRRSHARRFDLAACVPAGGRGAGPGPRIAAPRSGTRVAVAVPDAGGAWRSGAAAAGHGQRSAAAFFHPVRAGRGRCPAACEPNRPGLAAAGRRAGGQHRAVDRRHSPEPAGPAQVSPWDEPMTPRLTEIWVYLSASPLLWLTATLVAYQLAVWLSSRARGHPLANPVALAVAMIIVVLTVTGTRYETYFDGA